MDPERCSALSSHLPRRYAPAFRNDADYWAVATVRELIRRNANEAWEILSKLVDRGEDDSTLALIAAGPLEDLIVRHGPEMIDRIEGEVTCKPKLRQALSAV